MVTRGRYTVAFAGAFLVGCGGTHANDAVARAHAFVVNRCANVSESDVAAALDPASVEGEEAESTLVQAPPKNQWTAQPGGARVYLRPARGMTRELLARALECHAARVAAGEVEARADDPYGLPGRNVGVQVDSSGDGFIVRVRAGSSDDAATIRARAKRLAGE